MKVGLLLLLLTGAVFARPNRGPFRKIAVIHLREDAGEAIDTSVKQSVLRRLEQIEEWGADCIILDIESYGGYVHSSIETGDEIFAIGRKVHTIAYVGRKAISGAALLALSCQEIVISEAGQIGDAQAVYPGADGTMKQAPEKAQSVVAATFRKYSEANGYPVAIAESMVRQEMEVVRYRKRGDPPTYVYYRSDTPGGLPSKREIEEQELEEPTIVVHEGELGMFTARQAQEYGLASRIENDLDALVASLKAPDGAVAHFEWTWAERVSRFLLGWRFVLFLLGAGALYFSLKVPGTGIPEVLAVLAFGLFFGASAIAGFAGTIEVVLFFAGVVLLVVEIFILPGFGVPGFLGLACILVSIGLAAIPEGAGEFSTPAGDLLLDMAKDFLLGVTLAVAVVVMIARYLPNVPYFSRLRLAPAARQTGSAVGAPPAGRAHPLLGAKGVAETRLRPAGRAVIDGKRVDVVTEGRFVEPGTPVEVVDVKGNVVTVRPA